MNPSVRAHVPSRSEEGLMPEAHDPKPLQELVREVVSIPTASYLEHGVRAYLREFASERGLEYAEDAFGNAYIRYQRGRARRPLVLSGHTDHPGFVVASISGHTAALDFRGGLSATYGKGERLRFFGARELEPRGTATITEVRASERNFIDGATAQLDGGASAAAGDLALWDVPVCNVRGEIVHARGCDDLIGCVAVLATLDRAVATRATGTLVGLFTRAEEVGLRGASVVGRAKLLPQDALIVAVETSSMAGGRAVQGGGPIVRVGDATHIFSPGITRWMTALAQEFAAADPAFKYQRKLMDGGTTEATAYDLYGYETGAACIALGNYHNAGPRGRVAAETVHLGDLDGLVRIFLRMLETVPKAERYLATMRQRLDRLGREAAPLLRASR
jgi:putative aminopeptidase FrvX